MKDFFDQLDTWLQHFEALMFATLLVGALAIWAAESFANRRRQKPRTHYLALFDLAARGWRKR